MPGTFRSLSVRNYRLWFVGALISNVGGWMQGTAQNWVVLTELTDNNATAVGVTMALQFGPQLILVPWSGAVADRFDRRKLLILTQVLLMLLAAGLGVMLVLGVAELWHLYAFALGLGFVNAFDMTARQAYVSDLVEADNLSNAVALNSALFNSARLVGPAAAGVLIALIGSGWVFLINALTFVAMVWALLLITTTHEPPPKPEVPEPKWKELAAGLFYVVKRRDMLVVFIMVFFVGSFSMNMGVMSAAMAVHFGRGAGDYGLLTSIIAIGSLSGALLAANRPEAKIGLVIISAGGLGAVSILAAFMPNFWTFAWSHVLFGLASATMFTTANGYVQVTAPSAVRGRVLALYTAIVMGGTPIGAPLIGWAADALGAPSSYVFAGLAALIAFAVGGWWIMAERRDRAGLPVGPLPEGVTLDVEELPSAAGDPHPALEEILLLESNSAPQEGAPTTGVIHLPPPPAVHPSEEPEERPER